MAGLFGLQCGASENLVQQPLLDQSEQNYGDKTSESLPSISDTSDTHSAISDFDQPSESLPSISDTSDDSNDLSSNSSDLDINCESIREHFFKP
jgi:hypothetical protein